MCCATEYPKCERGEPSFTTGIRGSKLKAHTAASQQQASATQAAQRIPAAITYTPHLHHCQTTTGGAGQRCQRPGTASLQNGLARLPGWRISTRLMAGWRRDIINSSHKPLPDSPPPFSLSPITISSLCQQRSGKVSSRDQGRHTRGGVTHPTA